MHRRRLLVACATAGLGGCATNHGEECEGVEIAHASASGTYHCESGHAFVVEADIRASDCEGSLSVDAVDPGNPFDSGDAFDPVEVGSVSASSDWQGVRTVVDGGPPNGADRVELRVRSEDDVVARRTVPVDPFSAGPVDPYLRDWDLARTTVAPGEDVEVDLSVANSGGRGRVSVELYADGEPADSAVVELDTTNGCGALWEHVVLSPVFPEPGEYDLRATVSREGADEPAHEAELGTIEVRDPE